MTIFFSSKLALGAKVCFYYGYRIAHIAKEINSKSEKITRMIRWLIKMIKK